MLFVNSDCVLFLSKNLFFFFQSPSFFVYIYILTTRLVVESICIMFISILQIDTHILSFFFFLFSICACCVCSHSCVCLNIYYYVQTFVVVFLFTYVFVNEFNMEDDNNQKKKNLIKKNKFFFSNDRSLKKVV